MPAELPASVLVPLPDRGRRFTGATEVRLGDTDPRGQLRLDAIARALQDVANDDARDADLPNANGWVVRRTMIVVEQPAVLAETLSLTTFCGGTGRAWAERRTSITGSQGAAIEAVSLWVQVDGTTGRPTALGPEFDDRYGEAAGGRQVSTRLTLPPPPPDAVTTPWPVRAVDLDVFGHVNNAVAWAIVEELIADGGAAADRIGTGVVEHLRPLDRTVGTRFVSGASTWLADAAGVCVAASWSATS